MGCERGTTRNETEKRRERNPRRKMKEMWRGGGTRRGALCNPEVFEEVGTTLDMKCETLREYSGE